MISNMLRKEYNIQVYINAKLFRNTFGLFSMLSFCRMLKISEICVKVSVRSLDTNQNACGLLIANMVSFIKMKP